MRLVRLTLLLSCLAAVLVPAQATAAEYAFRTLDPITIPHQGTASPYPSAVFVSGARGPVSDIEGTGRDLLLGGAGRDRLIGGPGADVARQ